MKYLKALLLVISLSLLLSGCSFSLFSTAEELIYPISPSGENANIQKALDSYFKNGYSLKTPIGGEHRNSYNFFDIDGDTAEEVIVFCNPSFETDIVYMVVIDKIGSQWNVACDIKGEGAEIYSLDFCDLNNDKKLEVVALWDSFSNSTSHILTVYTQSADFENIFLSAIGKPVTMNNYISGDFNNDSKIELLVLTVDSGDSISANAMLYSYSGNKKTVLGSTKLDGHISSYKNITSEYYNSYIYVYADALKSNGSQMLTEVIVWSDYYGTIISPFYSYSTGITAETTRSAKIYSQDVDSDGLIEIPLDADKKGLPVQVKAINWKHYRDSVLDHASYSIAIEKDNYQIVIPDEYFNDILISYNTESNGLTVNDEDKKMIFSVIPLLKTQYYEDTSLYSDYTEIMTDSGYIYLAVCGNDSNIKITAEDLKTMIKSY